MSNILTNDPSFTAWGVVVLNEKSEILYKGCIKTSPEQKARRIRKGDDRIRRISEINQELKRLIDTYEIKLILAELPHGSQNASAAVMMGSVAGMIQTISDFRDIPVEWFSEQDAKKAVLGKKAATKEEMIRAIGKLYTLKWTGAIYKDEAIADALAIHYVAVKQSNMIKMLRQ